MATNGRTWPLRLKQRCEAVGWVVTMSKAGHYKVRTKRGRGFSFPSTPGDRRAELNALAEARRHGIERLEARLEQLNERDRQARIKRDRTSVGAALMNAVVEREDETQEDRETMAQKEIAQKAGALGYVDGVAVAERAPAMHTTPISRGPRPLTDGEELLLVDGNVVYRCAKPAATVMDPKAKGICHRTFDTVSSLKSHITYHSRTTLPTTPAQRRAAASAAERESTRDRVARVAKAAATPASVKATKPAETSAQQPGIVARMVALTEQFEGLQDDLEQVGKRAEELSGHLAALARELPDAVASDELRDKAQRWDDLRKQFG